MRPVQREDGMWIVLDASDNEVAGPFVTEDEAWEWIDKQKLQPTRPKIR